MSHHGYGQFCPVAKAAEVLTERWTPLVVRELLMGSCRFNDLRRGVPLMSPTLLSQRLRALEEAGVIERRRGDRGKHWEYHLTVAGEELRPLIELLGTWGQRWARTSMRVADLDVTLLMWDIRRGLRPERAGRERIVVRFEFWDAPQGKKHWWLVVDGADVDLCLTDPGPAVDLRILTDVKTMTMIWMGDVSIGGAVRSGAVQLQGARDLQRRLPTWLGLSTFAGVQRPTAVTHRVLRKTAQQQA